MLVCRHERARQRLEWLLPPEEGARFCATGEVRVGRAAETIRDVAVERRTDLIGMGTHGRSAVAHLLLGSVAEHVVRTAPCVVVTVRPDIAGTATVRGASLSHRRITID